MTTRPDALVSPPPVKSCVVEVTSPDVPDIELFAELTRSPVDNPSSPVVADAALFEVDKLVKGTDTLDDIQPGEDVEDSGRPADGSDVDTSPVECALATLEDPDKTDSPGQTSSASHSTHAPAEFRSYPARHLHALASTLPAKDVVFSGHA